MPKNAAIIAFAVTTFILPVFGIMVGNPTSETPYNKFGTGVEFDYEKWKIRYEGPDYRLNSRRVLIKPSLGIFRFTDIYGYFGMADIDMPSHSTAQEDFNGKQELAFGLGVRMHYAVFYPSIGCRWTARYPLRWYVTASWLTTRSSDEVQFGGGLLHFVDSYRYQNFDIGFYGSWRFGRTKPYIGVHWTYITGRKYRKSYSEDSGEPYARLSGFFNDPGQYPKPVIGLDIDIGKGYVLGLETSYWGKSETSIGIGLSQLYAPPRDEDELEQAIEKPE